MALETFKAQLKAKIKTLGVNLSTTRIDALAAKLHQKYPDLTEVADHDARIDDFNDLQPLADIAKGDDRLRTLEAKTKGQPKSDDQDDDDADDEPAPTKGKGKKKNADDPPAWAQSLIDEVKTLKAEKAQTSNATKLKELLKDKKIPDTFLAKYKVDKEEDLDTVATQVETDFTALKQELVNQGLMSSSEAPKGGSGGGGDISSKALEANIDSWVASKAEPTTEKK